jgi:trk system potassium uptake protein TrkA
MYFLIVGAGEVGVALARWLVTAEHEIAVVDKNPSRCAAVDDELGSITVVGDGTEAEVLAKAGANRADVFIATTGKDDENMVACQLAKHRFGAARTISLANNPENERLFNLLRIDSTVNTTDLVVGRIQGELGGLLAEEVGGFND